MACADRVLELSPLTKNFRVVAALVFGQMVAIDVSWAWRGSSFQFLTGLALLATLVALPVFLYRTVRALGSGAAWLWALVAFVPVMNLVALWGLNSLVTAECRRRGIPMGRWGPIA